MVLTTVVAIFGSRLIEVVAETDIIRNSNFDHIYDEYFTKPREKRKLSKFRSEQERIAHKIFLEVKRLRETEQSHRRFSDIDAMMQEQKKLFAIVRQSNITDNLEMDIQDSIEDVLSF